MKRITAGAGWLLSVSIACVWGLSSCKSSPPLACESHLDCDGKVIDGIERPFCDLTGTLPGSDGLRGTCVPTPDYDAAPSPDGALADAMTSADAGPVVPLVGQLSVGAEHSCVLAGGNVRCWGSSAVGNTGQGHTNPIGDNEPASSGGVVALGAPATRIAAGHAHVCALLDSGAVRCWGRGLFGALGYGNTDDIGDNELPNVAGPVSLGAKSMQVGVAAGLGVSCARNGNGSARCWGLNTFGQLGLGNTTPIGDNETPVGPINIGDVILQIDTSGGHTCVLLGTKSVKCWGGGDSGRLGYADTANLGDNELPSSIGSVNVGAPVKQIALGLLHTCALLESGGVRCWGSASNGVLGYANPVDIGDNEVPATAGDVDIGGSVVQLSAGANHTCALLTTGGVRCWGRGSFGRLGYGNTNDVGDNETPASVGDVSLGGRAVAVAAGLEHTCALLESGGVVCWGRGDLGALGYGNTNDVGDNELPSSVGLVPL